jgi:hypothetical protein
MARDLVALETAETRFLEVPRPRYEDRWEMHAWELATRIDLLVSARAELEERR